MEHHISKFKAGGSVVNEDDENESRAAKIQTYANVLNTRLSANKDEALQQLNANPGLWIRLHPNAKSFVLSNLMSNAV